MKNLLYCLSTLIVVASCDPNQDLNGDYLIGVHYIPTNIAAAKQLKQMTSHLRNDAGQFEDQNISFAYSGAKLLSFKDSSGAVHSISYTGSDQISKIFSPNQTSDFEYAGANLSKVITNVTGIGKITATYSFVAGKLSKIVAIQESGGAMPVKSYYETTFVFQGENMTQSVTKNGVYNAVTGDLEMSSDTETVSFGYDTKKSPYKLLPPAYNLCLIGLAPEKGNILSANNAEKITVSKSAAPPRVTTFVQTYDSDNYLTGSTAGDQYISFQY